MASAARLTTILCACLTPGRRADHGKEYNVPRRYLGTIMSPWAAKRLHDFGGDISKFRVVKVWPSVLEQIAIAKTEPGDENNRIFRRWWVKWTSANWKTTRKTILMPTVTPAHCAAPTSGIMEFVEMFKAPIKVLHPLLTATQEGNYNGTEGISALPFNGIILACVSRKRSKFTKNCLITVSCPRACAPARWKHWRASRFCRV